jgi:hypothetical protein
MQRSNIITIAGGGLILIGILFLLQSLGVIGNVLALLWAVLFAVAGGIFLYVYSLNRDQWWAIIPGISLVGLGALIGIAEYGPEAIGGLAAGVFLGSIGLSFLVVYLLKREHWWTIIPGGVILSVAVMAALSSFVSADDWIAAVLFFGMTLTFVVLALLPMPQGKMTWAYIPAAVFLVIGIIILGSATGSMVYILPAVIIAVGLYILLRALIRR